MKTQISKLPAVVFLSLLLLLHGCTTLRPLENVDNPEKIIEQVKIGDEVVITTKSGEEHRMIITSISKENITGGDREVA
ncbi:MAG: hypothetical protein OEM95_10465 [Gammaproteobacteria bacterium]|nr:hypothetical protein [Gammaproteobacteria bacterium]